MNHTAQVLVELGAVLFTLGVLGTLAARIGLSPIPLYLLAGLAFGEGGLLDLQAPEGFFDTGADIGVILLLLLIGLEYTAADLVGTLRTQARTGVVDLILNGLPGVLFAVLLGWGPTAAVAMFGVCAISSSGIISKVLSDLGRLGNRETPTILGILVLEDLAMAVYLPLVTAMAAAAGGWGTVRAVSIALVVLAAVLLAALRYGNHITRLVFSDSNEVMLLRLVGLALLVAGLAEAAHVSAAVGAFLLGIGLSSDVADKVHTLLEPLRDIFAAVFFVFFGLSADPSVVASAFLPGLALAVLGVGTKLATGMYAARRAGLSPRAGMRAGATLVPRGEFSIIVAGLVGAAVTSELIPTVTAYVLILAVVGPLAPRLLEPLARRLPATSAGWTTWRLRSAS